MILWEEPEFQLTIKVWIIVFVLINAKNIFATDTTSAITVRETTQYSADIELVDTQHNYYVTYAKCNGTLAYTNEYKVDITEDSQVNEHFPDKNPRVWISNLIPNTNYTCVIVQRNNNNHKALSLVTFSTKYGAPLPPPSPEVTTETSNNQLVVTILLFSSSTKSSPISGYKLQFYVVEVDADGMPIFSQKKSTGLIASLEKARNSETPTDFLYQTYDATSLADTVIVQPAVLLGAFKSNYTYSAVLSAYRNETEGHEYEEATSEPSMAFKIIFSTEITNKYNFRARYARNVIGIVLGGVVPVLLCVSAIALLTMWCKYRKKKTTNARFQKRKHDQFKYPTFDATSIFSVKSASPQYQPSKTGYQMYEKPLTQEHGLMNKGMDAFRRTSVTLVNAFTNFAHNLQRYSWISDVDNLIEEDKEGCTESDDFVDAKEAASSSKIGVSVDPMQEQENVIGMEMTTIDNMEDPMQERENIIGMEMKIIDDMENFQDPMQEQEFTDGMEMTISDIQVSEDPERVMGSVITLCSTPISESGLVSDDQSKYTIPVDESKYSMPEEMLQEPLQ